MSNHFTRMATRYAKEVSKTGKFDGRPCGQLEILACQRFLDDLQWQTNPDFDWVYYAPAAETACEFIELMPHTKGKWAVRKAGHDALIDLEPWQAFIVCNIFGWFHHENGERRFTESYIEVARKNGKTLLMVAIAWYFAVADGEYAPEVYLGATSARQANIAFEMARKMAAKSQIYDKFCDQFGVEVYVDEIRLGDGGKLERLPANPGDGASPSFAGVDEYHEHKHDRLVGAMETGMGARENPHMMKITTAGKNFSGPCWRQRLRMVELLKGKVNLDRIFTIIFGPDVGDDYNDFENWKKANPNYGISVKEGFLRGMLAKAQQSSADRNNILTKHMNMWRQAHETFFDIQAWSMSSLDVTDDVSEEELLTARASMACDLAYKNDLVSVTTLFELERDGKPIYYVRQKFFCPEATVNLDENAHYQSYADDGELEVTRGNITDFEAVEAYIVAECRRFNVETVYYDTFGSVQLAQNIANNPLIEIDVCEFLQRAKYTTEPMRWTEALIKARRMRHNGGRCLTWCLGNVFTTDYADKGLLPRKETKNSPKKIDGAVTLIMAMTHFCTDTEQEENWFQNNTLIVVG